MTRRMCRDRLSLPRWCCGKKQFLRQRTTIETRRKRHDSHDVPVDHPSRWSPVLRLALCLRPKEGDDRRHARRLAAIVVASAAANLAANLTGGGGYRVGIALERIW